MNYLLVHCSNKIIHGVNNLLKGTLKNFKGFLTVSQDLKVNLCGLQQDNVVMVMVRIMMSLYSGSVW